MARRRAEPPVEARGGGQPTAAFQAIVEGRVQGVGFRYSARREALRLDLRGWVRNREDGSVEVFAEGEPAALEAFAAWLREGPPGAWIQDLRLLPTSPTGAFASFDIAF